MAKGSLVLDQNGTRTYRTENKENFILEFRDEPAHYDGEEVPSFPAKPAMNARVSAVLFRALEQAGRSTHFIRELNDTEFETHSLRRFPIKIVCRNVVAGSFTGRVGRSEGEILPMTIVEYSLEMDAMKSLTGDMRDAMYTEVSDGEVKLMYAKALRANQLLKPFMYNRGLILADYRIEFGRDTSGRIRIGGALCPDNCRIWDRDTHEKLDRDRFREPLRGTEKAYTEILRRIASEN